jgi:hypothetical protein
LRYWQVAFPDFLPLSSSVYPASIAGHPSQTERFPHARLPHQTSERTRLAQAVGRCPFPVEARVWSQARPCGLCGGRSGSGAGICATKQSTYQYHKTSHSDKKITNK